MAAVSGVFAEILRAAERTAAGSGADERVLAWLIASGDHRQLPEFAERTGTWGRGGAE